MALAQVVEPTDFPAGRSVDSQMQTEPRVLLLALQLEAHQASGMQTVDEIVLQYIPVSADPGRRKGERARE